jgi:hypothetical protein
MHPTRRHLPVMGAGDYQAWRVRRSHHGGGPTPVRHVGGTTHATAPGGPNRISLDHRLPHGFENARLILVRAPDLAVPQRSQLVARLGSHGGGSGRRERRRRRARTGRKQGRVGGMRTAASLCVMMPRNDGFEFRKSRLKLRQQGTQVNRLRAQSFTRCRLGRLNAARNFDPPQFVAAATERGMM